MIGDSVVYLMVLFDEAAGVPVARARARNLDERCAVIAHWRDGTRELDPDRYQVTIDVIPLRAVA